MNTFLILSIIIYIFNLIIIPYKYNIFIIIIYYIYSVYNLLKKYMIKQNEDISKNDNNKNIIDKDDIFLSIENN